MQDPAEQIKDLIEQGNEFLFLRYKSEYEIATYELKFSSVEDVYKRDLDRLAKINFDLLAPEVREILVAKERSLKKSLEVGVGNRSDYTNKNTYEYIGKHLKRKLDTGDLYITALSMGKWEVDVIKPRSPLTPKKILECQIDKQFEFESGKIRTFKITGANVKWVDDNIYVAIGNDLFGM